MKIKCLVCGDIIKSHYRWDFKFCTCENVFIDGGKDYFRYGVVDLKTIEFIEEEEDKHGRGTKESM